jgi:hypothetical protein
MGTQTVFVSVGITPGLGHADDEYRAKTDSKEALAVLET